MIENIIHEQFCSMIGKSGVHKSLGITANHVKVLRHRIRNGQNISLDKKIQLLKKSGWNPDENKWKDSDMVDLLTFYIKSNPASKEFGPAYIFERFQNRAR